MGMMMSRPERRARVVKASACFIRTTSRLMLHQSFGDGECRLHALFRFAAHLPADQRADEAAQPIRSAAVHVDEPESLAARCIGNQDAQLDGCPEVMAGVQHL